MQKLSRNGVILSGVAASRSETATQSKDPYTLPSRAAEICRGKGLQCNINRETSQAGRGPSTPSAHSQANGLTPLRMTEAKSNASLRTTN